MTSGHSGVTDARPLQVRVADDIRLSIERGELLPGSQLPTLDELAATYGCSLTAVRKAVDLLKQQGLVVSQHGKGTFVRERPTARRHGIDRYSRSRWQAGLPILTAEAEAQGRTAGQSMRELAEVVAPDGVATRLGLPPGSTVWVRRRTTLLDGRPNQLADSYYPLSVVERAPQLREVNTGPGGGFARLEEAGHVLESIREEWTVRMPTGPESVALNLPTGTPVVDLTRTTTDTAGIPVEVMIAVLAGDMVSFAYEFKVPD